MDYDQFSVGIRKTGFVLENKIAAELKQDHWTVISNKYYVDDLEGSIREIDLLAYKVAKVQHLDVYTSLLISCKKNESNIWALLARDINLKDPNSDWWPLCLWTNDKPLRYEFSRSGFARSYHENVFDLGVKEALSTPGVEVFAFQEMNKTGGSPQNDKNIFNAVTSLMKAQAYELSVLPQRKKSLSVYQFNLLSIIDSELIRIMFKGDEIRTEPIDNEHYIARYIIKKRESFSRIRFIKASSFKQSLSDYNQLHTANCHLVDRCINCFYEKALADWERTNQLIDTFREKLEWALNYRLSHWIKKNYQVKDLSLSWQEKEHRLAVTLTAEPEVFDFLNSDAESKTSVARVLKEIYRYTGEFIFIEDDLPF